MAKFITTIELHDADEKDYDKLYSELEKESFEKEKKAQKDKQDPTGKEEYKREGRVAIQEVTRSVLKAIAKTGKKYSFTIIKNKPVAG
jgi:hypothetical protein